MKKQIEVLDRDSCEQAKGLWEALSKDKKYKVLNTIVLSPVSDYIFKDYLLGLVDGGKLVIPVDQLLEVFPFIDGVSYELDLCDFPDKADNHEIKEDLVE